MLITTTEALLEAYANKRLHGAGIALPRASLAYICLKSANLTGADLTGADLTDADLTGATLRGATLTDAKLWGADLTDANLTGATLRGATLRGADLKDAKLWDADLTGANLTGADLRGANLTGATLTRADLRGANLTDADLTDADLTRANLTRADLRGADLTRADLSGAAGTVALITELCILPEGTLRVYKQVQLVVQGEGSAGRGIAALRIPEEARRSNGTSRKCRADTAEVLALETMEGAPHRGHAVSFWDNAFVYRVGETVVPDRWDADPWTTCGGGIHFYLTRLEAVRHTP